MNYIIYGISKGLGKAIAQHIPQANDHVFGISRSLPPFLDQSPHIQWISADLSNPIQAAQSVKTVVGEQPIDCLIYNVGIWEHNAFTDDYNFSTSTPEEIVHLINTNITACILAIQSFIENLKHAKNGKIILIGSTWGLENHNGHEVAFSASKFALRGMVHSLRENLRADNIGVSILNLGYLATEYQDEDTTKVLEETCGELIPLVDVIQAIKFILSTTHATCVKEIHMPAMKDKNM